MNKRITRYISIAMILIMASCSFAFAFEDFESGTFDVEEFTLSAGPMIEEDDSFLNNLNNVELELSEPLELPFNMHARANFWFSDRYLVYPGNITTTNPVDFYFFDGTANFIPVIRVNSSNSNMLMHFGTVNWNTGTFSSLLTVNPASGAQIYNQPLNPNLQYALAVTTANGTTGTYTIMANFLNPARSNGELMFPQLLHASANLNSVTINYGWNPNIPGIQQIVRSNGLYILHNGLYWEDNYFFNFGHGYTGRDQRLSDFQARNVYIGSFTNNQHHIPHALIIEIEDWTLWSYFYSHHNFDTGLRIWDQRDLTGQWTPRRLTLSDIALYGPHYVIIDLAKMEVAEFVSPLNYNFSFGSSTWGSLTGSLLP